jgi:hypothetical protein
MQTENSFTYKSQITEEWYEKANAFVPKKGIEYDWVWDYAKFRFSWAEERVQRVDSKAIEFLKVIIVSIAGFWPVIKFLLPRVGAMHPEITAAFIILSCLSLVIAGFFALLAYSPKNRLLPISEDVALSCADEHENKSEAMAKFCQVLAASTEYQLDTAARYGKSIKRCEFFLLLSFILLTVSFFAAYGRGL